MASTFFGLNIGSSALSSFQAAVNTTSNNIANLKTTGYCRQTANLQSTAALRVAARYGSMGTGVQVVSIKQERDLYYDSKYWEANSSKGLYEQKLYYLNQIEDYFKDDTTQKGFTTIFNKMFNGLDTLKTKAGDETVRNQFINQSQQLCTYFNALSTSLTEMQEDVNEEIKSTTENINAIGQKIATLNREINNIEIRGAYANELRDQRANLLDELSKIVDVQTVETEIQNKNGDNLGGTNFKVLINDQTLVDGNDYRTITYTARTQAVNKTDANGLYDLVWADTGMSFAQANSNSSGSLKALFEIRDGNNNDNLKGTVADTSTNNKLILKNTSVQNLNALNVPEHGQLTLNGKKYSYDGWSATLDADGKITEMEFNLTTESTLTDDQLANAIGNTASDGVSYDSKGIVYYQQQMNEFLRNFAEMFNSIEKDGQTLDGEQMGTFFQGETTTGTLYNFNGAYVDSEGKYVSATTNADGSITKNPVTKVTSDMDSYYKLTTANIRVNNKSLTDPKYFATTTDITKGTDAYDLVEKLKSLQSDVTMFRGDKASSFLETLLSDVTVDVDKTKTFYNNYNNLASSVDTHRTSISGVDEDEEAMNLIKFQNAYNLAAKTISVMAEMYDKLINETGVV